MKPTLKQTVIMLVGVLTLPWVASASPILAQRCSNDSLDIPSALNRIEWMRRCALGRASVPPTLFDTGMLAVDAAHLYDYSEGGEVYKYTGDIQWYDVNNTYVTLMYMSGGITQSWDGYYKWNRHQSRIKPRPLYPTFGTSPDINSGQQLWPHPYLANCTLYTDPNGTNPAGAFYVNGYCEASCYTPEQMVEFSDGPMPILDARTALREDLVTLTQDSTLDKLGFQTNQTYSYTEEIRPAKHTIIIIRTRSGGELRVTEEHPVIQGEGRIVQAVTLRVGDELVKKDGSLDPIVSVKKGEYYGKVYNIRPVTRDPVSNILIAQDFLVGSSSFQNDDVGYMNRTILYRSGIPIELIP